MKNGKLPTRKQKILLKYHGLNPDNWLVVKDLPHQIEVISRIELKKNGTKKKRSRLLKKEGEN